MTRVHVLSPGFDTPNARALLTPLIIWRRALLDAGFDCRIYRDAAPELTDCDVLLVDSKFHREMWEHRAADVLAQFNDWAGRCRVIYCDTTDSSGWLQVDVLPIVQAYGKAQLLVDRTQYLAPMYGQRPYSDYYHRRCGVTDREATRSRPIADRALLGKLRLSWNSGLADHSLHGPLRGEIYRRLPLPALLRFPRRFTSPRTARPQAFSCRFGISYTRESVAYQRRKMRELLNQRIDTGKVGRRRYFNELRHSRIVVSPFGYGEITLKDFEVFLTGGLLFKPDVSHLQTWPDLFVAGETMLAHAWDLSDFVAKLDNAAACWGENRDLAAAGQDRYRRHIAAPQASELFVKQFSSLVAH